MEYAGLSQTKAQLMLLGLEKDRGDTYVSPLVVISLNSVNG